MIIYHPCFPQVILPHGCPRIDASRFLPRLGRFSVAFQFSRPSPIAALYQRILTVQSRSAPIERTAATGTTTAAAASRARFGHASNVSSSRCGARFQSVTDAPYLFAKDATQSNDHGDDERREEKFHRLVTRCRRRHLL